MNIRIFQVGCTWLGITAIALPLASGCFRSSTTQNGATSNGAIQNGATKSTYVASTPIPTILAKDVSTAPLPTEPAMGTLHGQKYAPDKVQIQTSVSQIPSPTGNRVMSEITQYHVMLRQGSTYPDIQDMTVHINLKSGETLPGKSFAIKPAAAQSTAWRKQFRYTVANGGTPLGAVGVSVNWKPEGSQQIQSNYYSEKFSLRLQFGLPRNGKLPGQINMYLPDMEKSYIAGAFEVTPEPQDPEPAWNGPPGVLIPADVSKAPLPSGPAMGMLQGQKFVVDKAQVMSNGVLVLSQGKKLLPERSVTIYFFLDDKKTLAGKSYQVDPRTPLGTLVPHINMDWLAKGINGQQVQKRVLFLNKYSMRMQCGKLQNNKIPARINLRLPDKYKSYVAGSFMVDVSKP